MKTIAPEKKVF